METNDTSRVAGGQMNGKHPPEVDLGKRSQDSMGRRVMQKFLQHRLAVIGSVALVVLILVAVFAPVVAGKDPYFQDYSAIKQAPSSEHLLGTDALGRDVWARVIYATRVSLSVGLVAVMIYTLIGTVLGAIAGYYGGTIDSFIMRVTDVFMCFPLLIIIITVVALIGASLYNIMAVIGFLAWPSIARLVRGQFLSLREQEFISAATCLGVPNSRIIWRHLLPNCVGPITVAATFGMAGAILTEASLSFLGLGVPPPQPSWGQMLTDAQKLSVLSGMPWLWVPPGVMIAITVLCVNFLGDGLRDALDPRTLLK